MTLKSHIAIWAILATNFNTHSKTHKSMRLRAEKYDTRFFTVLLPNLGKDFERSLETGQLVITAPTFKRQKDTVLPQFMYEHFKKVFHKDGLLLDYPSAEVITCIRQLCMLFYKFESQPTAEQEAEAYKKFLDIDASVKTSQWPETIEGVRKTFLELLPDDPFDIRCHHASGATADKFDNLDKRLERSYMPDLMGTYDSSYFFQSLDHAKTWSKANRFVNQVTPSKVTLVPKDSRGPRIICMEPHERMFVQKGLQVKIYDFIENYSPAKGYINFRDQSINQRLAQFASLDRSLATIDLKDASDLVSWELIRTILGEGDWLDALTATRSATAKLQLSTGEHRCELKKFAPMGSALCFPIEAMLFYSISKTVAPDVWVYGDDIIVGTEYAHDVIKALESYGLLVNHGKTLIQGHFRESCGGDFFRGARIDYIRCKSYEKSSFISFCNLITKRYGVKFSDKLVGWYETYYQYIYYRRPLSEIDYPESLVYYTDYTASNDVFFRTRWDKDTQQWMVRRLQEVTLPVEPPRLAALMEKPGISKKIHGPIEQRDLDIYDSFQYDMYFDQLTQMNSAVAPNEHDLQRRVSREFENPCKNMYVDRDYSIVQKKLEIALPGSGTLQPVTNPVIKFVWGVKNPVL